MEKTYDVVLYMLNSPDVKLRVTQRQSKAGARHAMRVLAGRGWQLERREDVHTCGELVMTMEVHRV